ncbi:ATP-binding protein [Desulfolucanica intricata]|uniref:ATP-binding protein n=1 Tax=Desulfolucanica intricata TaxID=1285191 RepID=UPI0008379A3D|nr:ATP-binding protein [Desulfolucanica intricata]
MILRSITGKLWLAILVFVLIILGAMNIVQSFVLKDLFYQQQTKELISEGRNLAEFIKITPEPQLVYERIETMSDLLHATIVVIEINGTGIYGYGHNYGGMRRGMLRRYFSNQEDLEQLMAGNTVVHRGYHPAFEKELLWVAIPVQKGNLTTAAIFIHAPIQPISERMEELRTATLHILAGVFLLAIILSFFLSRRLSRPLLYMNQVAQSMVRGDYSRKVPVKSKDEIGLLARSLNRLSEELEEKITALEQLDQTRRDFVANVSHELRTPLTIMQGYTEAVLDGFAGNEEEQQKYLNNILEEILRLRRLVDDVLNLRSLETGQISLKKQRIDVKQIVKKVAVIFEPFFKERKIRFILDWQEQVPHAYGDFDRLEQVLVNLIDNALRYTPQGGEIKVKASYSANFIKVSVSDSGPGIPSDELPLIWERFHKVDKARSRAGEGSGLGLAISKSIIQAHKGEISAFSEIGGGTTLEFTLPIFNETI